MDCPKCSIAIDYLNYETFEACEGEFCLDAKNEESWTMENQDIKSVKFYCPNCGEELFDTIGDAVDFLKTIN